MSYIYTTNLGLLAVVHRTSNIINLIRDRGGLDEAYAGLVDASVYNNIKNPNAKVYAFGKENVNVDKAIEYPPLKVYKCGNGEIILSSSDLILANYTEISFIMRSTECKDIINLYLKGLREITRAIDLVL